MVFFAVQSGCSQSSGEWSENLRDRIKAYCSCRIDQNSFMSKLFYLGVRFMGTSLAISLPLIFLYLSMRGYEYMEEWFKTAMTYTADGIVVANKKSLFIFGVISIIILFSLKYAFYQERKVSKST